VRTRFAWVLVMEIFDELRRVVELSGEKPLLKSHVHPA